MDDISGIPRSSLDFHGLGELRARAQSREKEATRQTAQQFEAMFIQMMLKSMRDAVPKSDLLKSKAMDTFESMYDREIAVALSKKGGLGLADMMMKHLGSNQVSSKGYLKDHQFMNKSMKLEKSQKSFDLIRGSAEKSVPLNVEQKKPFPVYELRQKSFSIRGTDKK